MRYLSLDIEATGLREHDLIIELALVPFSTSEREIKNDLAFHRYVACPSFDSLKPTLDQWVIEHNEQLITKAHKTGIPLVQLKEELVAYLTSPTIKKYFNNEKIILFGKSMNAIDLPFLNRDLSWNFMRDHFAHRSADLTAIVIGMIEQGVVPPEVLSGSKLSKYLGMGEVAHTALEDAINTAKMFFLLLDKSKTTLTPKSSQG